MTTDGALHLLSNLGLAAIVVLLWTRLLELRRASLRRLREPLLGAAMAAGAIVSMSVPMTLAPGVIVDLRSTLVALAGLFGGPLGALVAAAPAALYRALLGGGGSIAGCAVILAAGTLGAAGHRATARREVGTADLLLLGIALTFASVASCLLLPRELWSTVVPVAVFAVGPATVLGIALLGQIFIEERRRHRLDRENALFRAMVETLPEPLNVKDREGRFLAANGATATLMQAPSAAALLGRSDRDFYPAAVADGFLADEAVVLARGAPRCIEQHARRKDGSGVWLSTMKVPFRDASGDVVGLVTHNRDITASKQLEGELESLSSHFEHALDNMGDGLALYDGEQRLVLCNERYRQLFPLTADLRVPGVRIGELLRASLQRGEQACGGDDPDAWIAAQLERFSVAGAREIELTDGRWLEIRSRPTAGGEALLLVADVTLRKALERELRHQALHDALTGLANRAQFGAELARVTEARTGVGHAVMLLDLDRFKEVNDTFGHAVGDRLLIEVGRRVEAVVRPGDVVARLGGDEFAVLVTSAPGREEMAQLAQRILGRLAEPFRDGEVEWAPSASIGLAFPADGGDVVEDLMVQADRALYAAKLAGRNRCVAFAPGMDPGKTGTMALLSEIATALAKDELDVDYQPILAVRTLEVVGVEALVRWNHPTRGRIAAGEFIAAAERSPVINDITRFVLRRALLQQRALGRDLKVWINLAPRCLAWDGLVDMVASELATVGVLPEQVVLEVTEGMIAGAEIAEARLAALRVLGVSVAIDDFGAGHSSLARLKALPLDMLKIDRAFVADVAEDERDQAIVRTVVTLGGSLGLTATAEGIETRDQLSMVRQLGCTLAQGYLFARPMPADQLAAWLPAWRERHRIEPGDDLLLRHAGTS